MAILMDVVLAGTTETISINPLAISQVVPHVDNENLTTLIVDSRGVAVNGKYREIVEAINKALLFPR